MVTKRQDGPIRTGQMQDADPYGSGIGGTGAPYQSSQVQAPPQQGAQGAVQAVVPGIQAQQQAQANAYQTPEQRVDNRLNNAVDRTPVLGQIGKDAYNGIYGGGQVVGGVLTGKRLGQSVISSITAGPLRALNNPPPRQYMGGSKEALEAKRAQYEQGMIAGVDQNSRGEATAMQGANVAGQGAVMGAGTYDTAMNLASTGQNVAQGGMASQDAMLGSSVANASQQLGSLAAAQQQMANDTQARQMQAQAAAARGGNSAAAMRNADMQSSQNALVNNQQLGAMRLQEEQARNARITQAEQVAAGQYGDRAAMGYGTAAQGLGAANTATGQVVNAGSTIGNIGGNTMQSGNTMSGNFINAEVAQNKAQLDADEKNASAKQGAKGGVLGMVGKAIGSIF